MIWRLCKGILIYGSPIIFVRVTCPIDIHCSNMAYNTCPINSPKSLWSLCWIQSQYCTGQGRKGEIYIVLSNNENLLQLLDKVWCIYKIYNYESYFISKLNMQHICDQPQPAWKFTAVSKVLVHLCEKRHQYLCRTFKETDHQTCSIYLVNCVKYVQQIWERLHHQLLKYKEIASFFLKSRNVICQLADDSLETCEGNLMISLITEQWSSKCTGLFETFPSIWKR